MEDEGMKRVSTFILSLLLLISFIVQGCTTLPNQPYLLKQTSEATPLKMARYETPRLRVYTTGGLVASIVTGAVVVGVLGAGIGYLIHDAVSIQSANPDVLDYGKLITDKFVERSKKEIPHWPAMTMQETFAIENASIDNKSYTLTLKVGNVKINANSGLSVDATITMQDKEGKIVWEKGYWYDPALSNRLTTFDALKADKYKKLNEELAFAADATVTDFINHFNNSKPPSP